MAYTLGSVIGYFFFLMIRRPPRSTLFPTRRSSDLDGLVKIFAVSSYSMRRPGSPVLSMEKKPRSEEHTSELQSRLHLVCRLLLEKKKTPASCSAGLGSDSLSPPLHGC